MIAEAIITVLLTIAALLIQMVCFLKDRRDYDITKPQSPYSVYWHWAEGFLHFAIGYLIGKIYGYQWGLLSGALTWMWLDGVINSFYLHLEFFNVGTTALIDKGQRIIAKILFNMDVRLLSGLLKSLLLLTSLLLLIKKYHGF